MSLQTLDRKWRIKTKRRLQKRIQIYQRKGDLFGTSRRLECSQVRSDHYTVTVFRLINQRYRPPYNTPITETRELQLQFYISLFFTTSLFTLKLFFTFSYVIYTHTPMCMCDCSQIYYFILLRLYCHFSSVVMYIENIK